MLNKYPM